MTNRVIDADGHICEPPAVWNDYVEKRHRADTIRVERDADGRDWVSINGAMRRNLRPAAACVPWGMDDPNNVPTWDDILPGSYDGGARAKVLEEEGIERSLLFPSLHLLAGDIEDPAVAAATCHGYNEWIADMCRDGRGKLSAVGIVPLQNPEAAAREALHIARLGLKGVCFRPERYKGLALYDDALAPFWQAVAGNGLFAAVHGSFGALMPSFATVILEAPADKVFATALAMARKNTAVRVVMQDPGQRRLQITDGDRTATLNVVPFSDDVSQLLIAGHAAPGEDSTASRVVQAVLRVCKEMNKECQVGG